MQYLARRVWGFVWCRSFDLAMLVLGLQNCVESFFCCSRRRQVVEEPGVESFRASALESSLGLWATVSHYFRPRNLRARDLGLSMLVSNLPVFRANV